MADDADRASEREEAIRTAATAVRKRVPQACGVCHWCLDPISNGRAFCDPEPDGQGCLRDWERAEAAKERNG